MIYVNTFFEKRLNDLFNLAKRVDDAFTSAGLEYRIVGGLATYFYVESVEPDAGRLTKDIDILVSRVDLNRIAEAIEPFGLQYRAEAGADMLVQAGEPSARRAVHLLFAGERARAEDFEPAPALSECSRLQELSLAPLADLVRMKLVSFRIKDEMHLKDLDEAGLISHEATAGLPLPPLDRLARMRSRP